LKEQFLYNPFAGVLEEDLQHVIVPKFNLLDMERQIANGDPQIIEFVGKKGRGKTTHLKCLHQRMNRYPLFMLNAKSDLTEIMNNPSEVVFIDSIHHLNLLDRTRLFKSNKTIIYTTHWLRNLECRLAKRRKSTYRFKGIDESALLASTEVRDLIRKFGDNYRGIMNHLYDIYQ